MRVITAPGASPHPTVPLSVLAGPALAPVRAAIDAGGLHDADLILDLCGSVRTASAPFGVWSFRLDASDDAALPFAAEIGARRRTVAAALVRRVEGRTEALKSGRFPITRWYPGTLRLALSELARWPATLASALAGGVPLSPEPFQVEPVIRAPTPLARARFLTSLLQRLGEALRVALLEVSEWNVGLAEAEPRRLLSGEPLAVRWLPPPQPLTFVADPFLAEHRGVRALFVESFDYREERGAIDAFVLDDADRVVQRVRAIDLPTHLSYPYPLELDGSLYLVPESCAANEVALYRCERFPDRWTREAALFPAFDAVDTTLFPHDGRWWAFCTRYSRGSTLGLNAFHADSPRGPWTPHALNPVVVDVSSARPGGQPFVVDGVLYRPGQDCSQSYGGGLVIARVDELTPTSYRETIVQRRDAHGFGRWSGGIHTVSFGAGRIAVDGKHVYRDVRKLPLVLKKGLRIARRSHGPAPEKEATFA
ncbi:MAG: hypothetical protein JOZ24_04935 [Candidatus Eremiobacteraeota bacterium]|nr:hypothetical protein [Candidatus Eremiobacteraeota bacterium]